jgi:hypothetical protein
VHVLFREEGQQRCLDVAAPCPSAASFAGSECPAGSTTATEAATLPAEAGSFVVAHIDSFHYHYM